VCEVEKKKKNLIQNTAEEEQQKERIRKLSLFCLSVCLFRAALFLFLREEEEEEEEETRSRRRLSFRRARSGRERGARDFNISILLFFWKEREREQSEMSFSSFVGDMMQGGGGARGRNSTNGSSLLSSGASPLKDDVALSSSSQEQQQQQQQQQVMTVLGKKRKFLKTFLIVCGWFASTVLLISFNKILMRDGSKFRLPIFLTFMHMCVAYVCCEIVLSFKERSLVVAFHNSSGSGSSSSTGGGGVFVSARQQLQSNRQFWKIFASSQTFAVSIVAAVASLEYLEVSFEQAIAACTPAVTAFMGMVILRKREHWRVWASLTPVILGGIVTAGAEPTFHAKGLALVLASMVARATKSCLQELLLSSAESSEGGKDGGVQQSEKLDSLNSLRWMSLMSVCTLLPASVEFEGVCAIKAALRSAYEENDLAWALCANCAGAFLVNISQFLVTQHVGALSMQVLGNVKTIVTVVFSVVIFKNVVGLRSLLGYALTLIGCFVYLREKRRREAIENNNNNNNNNNDLAAPLVGNAAAKTSDQV